MNVWQQWQQFTTDLAGPAQGLSPAEQVALRWGEGATPLGGRWSEMVQAVPEIGRMRWRVDNALGALEVAGSLDEIDATERTAIGRGPGVELRLLLSRWAFAYAVDVEPHRGLRSSLRAFDARGNELVRADLVADSDYIPYARMLSGFRNPDLAWTVDVETPANRAAMSERPAPAVAAVLQAWSEQRSLSDFYTLLRTFNLSRSEAYRQVEGEWAHRFPVARTGTLLERLAADEVPVSIAYANRGAILVHRGIVERVAAAGNAVCILDPGLRAELDLANVAEAWVVRQPTLLGDRVRVELLDSYGDAVVVLKEGRADFEPADPRWAQILPS